MKSLWIAAIVIALISFPFDVHAQNQIQSEYRVVEKELQSHCDGFEIDNAPESARLLDRKWSLIAEWMAFNLNDRSSMTENNMEAVLKDLDPGLGGDAIKLGANSFVISVGFGEIGAFFIISGQPKNYKVVWAVKDAALNHKNDGLSRWAVTAATKNPPFGSIGKLPKRDNGTERFYVDAEYSQRMGGTVGNQISIWEWDGVKANPVFMKDYVSFIDGTPTKFREGMLRIHTKEPFKSLFSCGSCPESDNEWTIAVTNDGINDLGLKPLVPELEAVDELFYRIQHDKPAADLASQAVLAGLEDIRNGDAMLGDWQIERKSGRTRLCIMVFGRRLFTMHQSGSKVFITGMKDVGQISYGNTCKEVLTTVQ
jgi:hypothetical protein